MKIAVASMNQQVSPHFGHCEKFRIFEVEDQKVVNISEIVNPAQHTHGQLPTMLMQYGVNVVIVGGIGGGAKQLLQKANIAVYSGISGDGESAVNHYMEGKLVDADTDCGHHHDKDHDYGHRHGHHH